MSLIGLDLNSSRALAVHGPAQPALLALDADRAELPLALSLEGTTPEIGRAGVALCRAMPHMACLDFLPQLGGGQRWTAGRHRLDASAALALVFEHLHHRFGRTQGTVAALPPYLTQEQEGILTELAGKARWRLLGTVPTPLAVALAGREHLPWTGTALVIDVDSYALTWSAIEVEQNQVRLLACLPSPRLGWNAWVNRLVEQVAHRCIMMSRRDPRESAEAEQALFDQLCGLLSAPLKGPRVDLVLQTKNWAQHLMFHPDELAGFCTPLVQQTMTQLASLLPALPSEKPTSVLATYAASSLPGLLPALKTWVATKKEPEQSAPPPADPDFGDALLLEEDTGPRGVWALDADAVARAAHALAVRIRFGELLVGPLHQVPLPPRVKDQTESGPARLEFRGQEHVLSGPIFSLGRDPSCNLVFETELYPTVSARHCEIVLDRRTYTLRDRSRHGTLVNDQPVNQQVPLHPGDWIRLGPVGPVLRFLGNKGRDEG